MKPFIGKGNVVYYTSWVIAFCDIEILNYYKWWYLKRNGIKLQTPRNGAHISIVRGEEENIDKGWWERNLDSKEVISFNYGPDLKAGSGYVWLDIDSQDLEKIRTKLGLDPHPPFGYHLTIGRI